MASVFSFTPLFAALIALSQAFYTDRRVRMVNDIVKRKVTNVSKRWDDYRKLVLLSSDHMFD